MTSLHVSEHVPLYLYVSKTFFVCVCLFLAWQQHDIQELCRVMFDALEQKWKQTEQVGESETFSSNSDNDLPASLRAPATMETKEGLWEK